MKTLKIGLIAVLLVPMIAAALAVTKPAEAQASDDLNELIVMSGLFTDFDAGDLAGLIAVDDITGGGSIDGGSDLADLIVLGGLFDNNWGDDAEDLAGLIAVDNIF